MAPGENETSGGETLSVPAVPTEGHQETEGPSPGPSGEAAGGSTLVAPSVNTEGHIEIEGPSPGPSGEANEGATTAGPSVAASVGSSPGAAASYLGGGLAGAPLGQGEDAGGYLGSLPSVPANPTQDSAQIETPIRGGQASGSRTGALPEVAATPNPLGYKPLHT